MDLRRSRRALRAGGFVVFAVFLAALGGGCRTGATAVPDGGEDAPAGAPSSAHETAPGAAGEAGWAPVAEEDGILVASRPSERSALPVFRGVARVEAPLLEVLAVITDADRHHQWLFSCSESALVAQTSDATGIVYNRTDAPWPVPDRDVVLESRVELPDGEREAIVRFSATEHPDRPPTPGVVRMPYLQGHYRLWAEGEAITRVEYQVDSDPGGSLPAWLATRGTRDMPLETLRALRRQLARTRGAHEARIDEFRRTLLRRPADPPAGP